MNSTTSFSYPGRVRLIRNASIAASNVGRRRWATGLLCVMSRQTHRTQATRPVYFLAEKRRNASLSNPGSRSAPRKHQRRTEDVAGFDRPEGVDRDEVESRVERPKRGRRRRRRAPSDDLRDERRDQFLALQQAE